MIVVDSDVLIDALAGQEPSLARLEKEIRGGRVATTTVNVFELLTGSRDPEALDRVESLLSPFEVLALDEPAAQEAAEARRTLEARGEGIHLADYLIAGVCLRHSAPLLTRNHKHFERVPRLVLASW